MHSYENSPLSPSLLRASNFCKTPRRSSFLPMGSGAKTEQPGFTPCSEEKTDRFIPLRGDITSKNLFTLFQCQDVDLKLESNSSSDSDLANKENNYKKLLENELLSIPDLDIKLRLIGEENGNRKPAAKINRSFIFSSPKKRKRPANSHLFTQKKAPHLLKFKSPLSGKKPSFFDSKISITPFKMDLESSADALKPVNSREIPNKPFKTLDAPFLQDDFYLNLLDWSSQDLLSVILGNSVFLYNHRNSIVSKLLTRPVAPCFCSAGFDPSSVFMATGLTDGSFEVCDISKPEHTLFKKRLHSARVTTLAWNGPSMLATGSKDHLVNLLDLRLENAVVRTFGEHRQEVCGLKWSQDGGFLASGGNDNKVFVYSTRKESPELRFDGHNAAVKALAWSSSNRGVLLTGGGTNDTSIKAWNTLLNTVLREVKTDSQVCNLIMSKSTNEFVSSHGFEKNEIAVWDYESFERRKVLRGHTRRVLFMCMSKDGRFVATGAGTGDETVKIWDVFPESRQEKRNCIFDFCDLR